MKKHWYAGRHCYGREFSFDQGWTVYVFATKADRDEFVDTTNRDDHRRGWNPRSEAITRDIARHIAGGNVKETPMPEYNGHMLDANTGYYTAHYWD